MIPRTSDGQLLFLLNNISKMKKASPLGSRIAEVHNGSSIFTGDAGSGESNARRYIIENDLVEAIIALPDRMFYNTPLNTYIWVLTNRKEDRRKGKIQLIDATALRTPLLKKLGDKSFQLSTENQRTIVEAFIKMETSSISHIYDNSDFGFWKIYIIHPKLDEKGQPLRDNKGKYIPDKTISDTEIVPFNYEGGIEAYIEKEVHPYAPYSWVDEKKTQIGYEISFTKCFYKPEEVRSVMEVNRDLAELDSESRELLDAILGGAVR